MTNQWEDLDEDSVDSIVIQLFFLFLITIYALIILLGDNISCFGTTRTKIVIAAMNRPAHSRSDRKILPSRPVYLYFGIWCRFIK